MTEYYWAKDKKTGELEPVRITGEEDMMTIGYDGYVEKRDFTILGRIKCPRGYKWKMGRCEKVK